VTGDVLFVNQEEVPGLLAMDACMAAMERVLATLARGDATLPLRTILWLPEKAGGFGLMPSLLPTEKVLGVKVITFFPKNEGTELDTHQGAVLLFEADRGRLIAVIDATSITAIRTAAVSGVATKLLAREDASELALIGSGVQARTHLEAVLVARRIRRVRVASQSLDRAKRFADRESARRGVPVQAVETPRAAVEGADIVCTCTSAREPVVEGAWLSPGTHINAVGSSVPFARELDTAAVVRSRLYADRRESLQNEAGDFLIPKKEGAVSDGHIVGEIGEILIGKVPGRRSKDEVTLFKSLGLSVEDVASAKHIYEEARRTGTGRFLPLGGGRHDAD